MFVRESFAKFLVGFLHELSSLAEHAQLRGEGNAWDTTALGKSDLG